MKDSIVVYPAPGIGHIVSMVELAKLLHPKYSIHVLITTGFMDSPSTTSYLQHISQTHPSITFHHFPLQPLPSPSLTPPPSPAATAFEFIRLNSPNVNHSLRQISQTSTIRSLIIDFFCTSALPIAAALKIPTLYFFTSGAAALATYLYFPQIHTQITNPLKDLTNTQLHIPGLPTIKASQMPEPVLDRNDPAYHDILYFSLHLFKSDGIIVNTFEDLEPIAIKSFENGSKTPPIYYIGPLIVQTQIRSDCRHDCLVWLDFQPSKSVVFLCFGSRGSFSVEQLKEIAIGLERSGHRFLWVIRIRNSNSVDDVNDVFPEGFLERTKERGMVVVEGWVPQMDVLTHEAVGGFVTHCGWNSVLEAVLAGVPMVAWPLYAEQHVNKAALVEDMRMAIPVVDEEEGGFVSGAELERRVRELMESESGRELRERSLEMREKALAAWGPRGSTTASLAQLIQVWSRTS